MTAHPSTLERPAPPQRRAFQPWMVLVALLAVLATGLALLCTRSGPGLSPDSRAYLMGARFLLQGHGIAILSGNGDIEPMTHYGPLPCILLATVSSFGPDAADAARYLHALLFAGSVILAGLIAFRATRMPLAAMLAAALLASSYDLLRTHAMVWSEPSFIFFMLLGVLLLGSYLQRLEMRWLLAGSVVIGIAFLARYSGVALVMSCAAAILLHGARPWRRRIIDTAIFGAVSALPMAIWVLRNLAVSGNAANRQLAFHPPRRRDIELSVQTVVQWLVPAERLDQLLTLLLAGLLIAAWFIARRRRAAAAPERWTRTDSRGTPQRGLILLLMWFVPIYLAFLLFSITFVDALTPLDYRILSPLHAVLLILLAIFGARALARRRGALRAAVVCGLMVLISGQLVRAAGAPITGSIDLGYSESKWTESPALRWVRTLPADTVLYSNAQEAMYFGAQRFARPIPKVIRPLTRKPATDYRDHLAGLARNLRENGGYVVYFRHIRRPYLVSEEKLVADLQLVMVQEFPDAAVYQMP